MVQDGYKVTATLTDSRTVLGTHRGPQLTIIVFIAGSRHLSISQTPKGAL